MSQSALCSTERKCFICKNDMKEGERVLAVLHTSVYEPSEYEQDLELPEDHILVDIDYEDVDVMHRSCFLDCQPAAHTKIAN